jgi:hypothetical protein
LITIFSEFCSHYFVNFQVSSTGTSIWPGKKKYDQIDKTRGPWWP